MSKNFRFYIKSIWVNIGWFPGNEFALLDIELLKLSTYENKIDFIVLFSIQITKLYFAFGWSND